MINFFVKIFNFSQHLFKNKILTLNEKVDYKTVIECGKKMSNIFIGLKKTCLGVLDREKRDTDNEAGLKEGG